MVCKLCHATTHAKSAHELIEKLASDPTQQRLKSFNRLSEEKREEYAALQTEDGNTMLLVLVFGLGKSVPTETHVEVAKTLIDLGVDIGDKSGGKTAAQIFKVNQTEPDEGSKGRIFYDQLLAILNGETPPPTPAPSAATSAAPAPVEAKKKVESTESSSGDIKTTEKAATTIAASKKPAQASTSEIQSSAGSEVKSSPKKAAKPSSKIAASAASGGKKKSSDELPSNIVVAEQPPTDVPELPSFTEAVPAKKIPAKKATTSPPQATKKVAAPPAATNSPPQATKNANAAANKKAQAGQAGAKPRAKPTTTA